MKPQNKSLWQLPLIMSLALMPFSTISTASAQNVPEFLKMPLEATVYIEMQDKSGNPLGTGNGFFVLPNIIVTNTQVIEGAASGTVKLITHPKKYKIEGITAADEENNLVLLKVGALRIRPPSINMFEIVKSGVFVYITGNKKGVEATISDNRVSNVSTGKTGKWLQLRNPVFPASSGGPVLNQNGGVIGIFFLALDGKQKNNFVIPSSYIKQLIAQSGQIKPLSTRKQSVSAETYFRWGYINASLQDFNDAIANYTQAIRLKPDYVSAYNNRGIARDMLKQHADAISDYDMVIHLKPDDVIAYNHRGIAKAQLGQYENAIKDYDKAIKINKNLIAAYGNRGRAKEAIGQYTAAMADYNRVIRFRPEDPKGYYNRGNLHFKLKKYDAALDGYNQAILLQPNYINAYYSRGITKLELERTLEAKHDLQMALKLVSKTNLVELKTQIEKALQQLK